MIPRKQIIFAMGSGDISDRALFHMLSKYVTVCMSEIEDIIKHGIKGWLRPYVAFVLRIRDHIPKGFNPPLKVIKFKVKDLPRQLTFDHLTRPGVKGAAHHWSKKQRKKNDRTLWADKEIGRAVRLRESGLTYKEIGDKINRTRECVTGLFRRIAARARKAELKDR